LRAFYVDPQGREPRAPLDALPRVATRWSDRSWRAGVSLATWLGLSFDTWLGNLDVFHATDHLLPPLRRTKSVFTLLDLTSVHFPETQAFANRVYTRTMLPSFVRRADALIAISESTKQDAMAAWGIPGDRIHAISLGVRADFRRPGPDAIQSIKARYRLPERYLFFVGTIEPRKNLEVLYLALARMRTRIPLVVAGRKGWLSEGSFRVLAREGVTDRVQFLGRVPDEDLPALYAGADLFVFPSWYEGFGLPLLEAMACGTPVVASDRSSMPEVMGDAGVLLSPENPSIWAATLDELLEDADRRRGLAARGASRAAGFTWEKAAQATLEVYRGVCAGRS